METHANKYENNDPEFAREVKKHFYMDDRNSGAQSTKEGFEFFKQIKSRFSEANFNIRKWRTNVPELHKLIHDYENREVVNIKRHVNNEVSKYANNVIVEKYYLHGFSDALNLAYAAVAFIKAVTKYGDISVSFVTSNLRIVSLNKSITIPRLENLENFILSNLIPSVSNSLIEEIFIEEIIC